MDMLKNDLIQEIKHNKMRNLFWIISLLSGAIILGIMRVFHDFNIEFSSTLAWVFLAIYIVVVLIFLAIYRLMAKVSEKEITKLVRWKQQHILEQNACEEENIEFYGKVIEQIKEKNLERSKNFEQLKRFL